MGMDRVLRFGSKRAKRSSSALWITRGQSLFGCAAVARFPLKPPRETRFPEAGGRAVAMVDNSLAVALTGSKVRLGLPVFCLKGLGRRIPPDRSWPRRVRADASFG